MSAFPRAAASRRWCRSWDEASERLLATLRDPRPVEESVRELIDRRQRLTTAQPRANGPDRQSESDQSAWLERAVVREEEIRRAYLHYREVVTQSREGFRAGARVRATFRDKAESIPTRLFRKV